MHGFPKPEAAYISLPLSPKFPEKMQESAVNVIDLLVEKLPVAPLYLPAIPPPRNVPDAFSLLFLIIHLFRFKLPQETKIPPPIIVFDT